LANVYTKIGVKDVFQKRAVLAATLANDALVDTSPLRKTIARNLTSEVLRAIAREYAKGRLLLVLATNLDQGRASIWNIGAIARHAGAEADASHCCKSGIDDDRL
jgi:hypothetical protein